MNKKTSFDRLLQACKQKKQSGQRELYRRYFAYGMTVCLHYTNRQEEAEEVLNDAFFKVFNFPSLVPSITFINLLSDINIDFLKNLICDMFENMSWQISQIFRKQL